MRDHIDVLLDRIDDPALRGDLRAEVDRLRSKRSFGLVFEHHLPERVRLHEHAVRVGSTVVFRDDPSSPTYEVTSLVDDFVTMHMVRDDGGQSLLVDDPRRSEAVEAGLREVVVITDFGALIHPGLRHLGSVHRGGDKPSHVVIKGENHHVLEALRFTHAGKVDCIYIDPPYNTGARDWKYDNDYVDDSDAYRHSKWLAFMERRLLLAKELLNPDDSVLIVTIDEKEVHRLALLAEQIFPSSLRQMVTIVINPLGQARKQELGRVEEYAIFVLLGSAQPVPVADDLLNERQGSARIGVRWEWLLRGGTNSRREDRPNLFFPIFVDPVERRVVEVGEPLPLDVRRDAVPPREGAVIVWPLRMNGDEGNWRASHVYLRALLAAGYARVGAFDATNDRWSILYLGKAQIQRIESGDLRVVGRDRNGAVQLEASEATPVTSAKTVWNRSAHRSGEHGSTLMKRFVPGSNFPFPKSLFAVEDSLRVAVGLKKDAVVLDFFAGSGTTTHAVARLNRQDGGKRQSILVTNNEVSADEAKAMRERGLYPGHPEWEALGIFEHVTRPRIEAAITGLTPEGEPVKGDYKFTDEFPMAEGFEENVDFCELIYLDPDDVELDLAFDAIAPLLWLRAGASGPMLTEIVDDNGVRAPFAWTERYGVLFQADRWRAFVAECPANATAAFVVTDSASTFAGVASELPDSLDVVRLYESYLTTFSFTPSLGSAGR